MFKWIAFEQIEERHVDWLSKSLLAAPEPDRPDVSDLLRSIMNRHALLFEFDCGIALCTKIDKRLRIDAFAADRYHAVIKNLVADLRRLAADWECDTIVTFSFDPRLTSVIKHLGGSVESVTVTLPVETPNGRD